jgi:hypothetical protein
MTMAAILRPKLQRQRRIRSRSKKGCGFGEINPSGGNLEWLPCADVRAEEDAEKSKEGLKCVPQRLKP